MAPAFAFNLNLRTASVNLSILIPAYNPGPAFPGLIRTLANSDIAALIVVNDGSGPEHDPYFAALADLPRVYVLHHAVNLGKGAALKTAMNFALYKFPGNVGVVTADADGQHDPEDILRIARLLTISPGSLILGCRRFDRHVPLRSRWGNQITRTAMRVLIGQQLSDTQTGLRGVPQMLLPGLLRIPSSGYEFELDMLIACKHADCPVVEEPIRTIYTDGNQSSHFNPLIDSMRIYFVLLRFTLVAVITAVIDNTVFFLVFKSTANILLAQIAGRLVAMTFNYNAARRAVFQARQPHQFTFLKYVLLVAVNGAISYAFLNLLMSRFLIAPLPAKLISESILFIANFAIQRDFVFTNRKQIKAL